MNQVLHSSSAKPFSFFVFVLAVLLAGLYLVFPMSSFGQPMSFRTFSHQDGLTDLGVRCVKRDRSGYILACTEQGLYAYDGQRFFSLGPQQGLPDGGVVHDLAFSSDGRIILRYPDRIFVSQDALSPSHPPESLHFQPAKSLVGSIFDDRERQLTSWANAAVLLDQGSLYYIGIGKDDERSVVQGLDPFLHQPEEVRHHVSSLFGLGKTLWVGLLDGRICRLNTVAERCFGPSDGLPDAGWYAFLPDGKTHLLVRSLSLLANIDLKTNAITVEQLPDQAGGAYSTYFRDLFLVRTPSDELVTQSASGLIIRGKTGWRTLTAANGLPKAPITSMMFDDESNVWIATLGRGMLKAPGYGLWENWDHSNGLSSDYVWQMARSPDGPLWVATDGGVDAIGPVGPKPVAHRHYDTPSFAIAVGGFDHVWRSFSRRGVGCIATASGTSWNMALPSVNQILRGERSRLWFMTEDGLYYVDDLTEVPTAPTRIKGMSGSIAYGAASADGSLWMLVQGQLIHRHSDGTVFRIRGRWSQPGFDPVSLAIAGPNVVWIGGAGGGLYRVDVTHDEVRSSRHFSSPDILSNTVVSVAVDNRGWVWAGTNNGISVFDGQHWVSADSGNGLIWNDLDQDSLFEDSKGSMWIGTSQGLSHLLEPARLFDRQSLQAVISAISLGDEPLPRTAIPYSQKPLSLSFGALNIRSDVRFLYRMEGVDKFWAKTISGSARYPFLPPGHHRFLVVAYDPLTRQFSPPTFVVLRMKEPWWFWWPFQALYALVALTAIYGTWRLRFRYLLLKQRNLHHEVEVRTKEMRAAQAELVLQATQDSLTQLLTRGEIQRRLVDGLARGSEQDSLTIGLLDIDHFKRINDRLGHIAGDDVLREMGLRLKTALKAPEFAGRYGGEELLIVLNDPAALGASRIHELKLATCGEAFLIENESIYVTCSIGVARSLPEDDWKSLIGRADRALYRAKAEGRDRVIEALDVAPGD